ncbi:TIGR03086 family protein [Thermomonospora echinospora]|uniref:TIGR03086 family protein n=1 Tax=Thermomonospora echinospora TaxID=1992 RepID=A0A1H5VI39_9ACTN|nr:TIGR03086 family metal-binding protein [Thermomonospora echinospora]SEF86904.1 TIGR03086 family protein [Thermomonospora echinospora]
MTGGLALLERAVNYTLGSLLAVTPQAMSRPTPCRDWDLRALLAHMNDSLLALYEAADLGRVDLEAPADPGGDPVAALRASACRLLGAWTGTAGGGSVAVADLPLAAEVVTAAGALEIAVHGWDVARACGLDRPIPDALAEELLPLSALLVTEVDRPARFAAPVPASPSAAPGDRLVARLGRTPGPIAVR